MNERRRRRRRPTFRHRLEYWSLRLLAAAIRSLAVERASALGGAFWRRFAPLTARHERVLRNLRLALPDLDSHAHRAIALAQWDNLGRTFAESFHTDRMVGESRRFEDAVPAHLKERVRSCGTGAVVVGLHAGNWEVAAQAVRPFYSTMGLYQRLANPLADRFVTAQRRHVFDGGLLSKGIETPRRVMRWVRAGNAVVMLADHREARGVPVRFFGRETTANPFPAMVARRLDVPLIAGRAVRLPGSRFRIEAVEIAVPRSGDFEADVRAASQAVQDQFEAWIRQEPGQWMWVHDRWRSPMRPAAAGLDLQRAQTT